MRVLVMCEYASLNGGERSLLEVAHRMTGEGIELAVAAPAAGPLADALRQYNLPHLPLDLFDVDGDRLPHLEIAQRVQQTVTRAQVNLVHANSLSMSRVVGRLADQLEVPTLGHLRDIMRVSRASIDELNQHQLILTVSEATRNWYLEAGLSPAITKVAYNGVDLNRFRPQRCPGRLHRELQLAPDTPLVGSIGQLGVRKGVDLLVEAAARLAARHQQVHFVFVGRRYSQKQESADFEDKVRRAANDGCVRGRFHFIGARDDIPSVLNELTVYVHAARQEPLGRVLLEAGAAGRAIVATDVGGTREIFPAKSGTALVVPPNDATALAASVARLLGAPETRHQMGIRARNRVADQFDAVSATQRLAQWYRELARGHA